MGKPVTRWGGRCYQRCVVAGWSDGGVSVGWRAGVMRGQVCLSPPHSTNEASAATGWSGSMLGCTVDVFLIGLTSDVTV